MCQFSQKNVQGAGAGADPEISSTPICSQVFHEITNDPSGSEAFSIAQSQLPRSIVHHSLRAYLYALRVWDTEIASAPTTSAVAAAVAAAAPRVTR